MKTDDTVSTRRLFDSKTLENQYVVADGFLTVAELSSTLDDLLESKFKTVEYKGFEYEGISELTKKAKDSAKRAIEYFFNNSIDLKECYFRSENKDSKPTSWIHADSCIAKHVMVLYLSNPPIGLVCGTAFWEHKIVGKRITEDIHEDVIPFLQRDSNYQDCWNLTDIVGFSMNRAVFYRTNVFHSRYPIQAWGDTIESSRNILVCFFDFDLS